MSRDRDLQRAVMDELGWEPGVKASGIGVSVTDGVVSLTGYVDSYVEKWAADKSAKRMRGVTAVANEIEVRLPGDSRVIDADIARSAENVLDWNVSVPRNRIKLTVEDGRITLEGMVDWQYQRMAAENAVTHLLGVRGISNQIGIVQKTTHAEVKTRIEDALKRCATVDAKGITVQIRDNNVVLSGTVRSLAEREEAARAAWSAPGVFEVVDHLRVES